MSISQSIASFLILSILAASIYGWVWFARERTIGRVKVPYVARRAVPWGLLDIILIMLAIVLVQIVVAAIATSLFGPKLDEASPILWMAISQVALLIAWGGIMALMGFRSATPLVDLGLPFRRSDLRIGVFAFAMMAPPMFALQAALSQFTDKQHPLIETLIEDSTPLFFLVGGFAAVVVAPVVEEFVFRVFLQGWLENLAAWRLAQRKGTRFRAGFGVDLFWGLGLRHAAVPPEVDPSAGTRGVAADFPVANEDGFGDVPNSPASNVSARSMVEDVLPHLDSDNPYESPIGKADGIEIGPDAASVDEPTEKHLPMRPSLWPVLASSIVFAAAHLGNGPDPIPLFFLAIGLGLLYQRTHRVWPCIVVHCLLNGISLFNLWVIVNSPELVEQLIK